MSLPIQAVQTLVSSLLQGQYAPTGIGTNPPSRLGPDPNRAPTAGEQPFRPGQASLDIMSMLAPYFALLGLGTNGATATGGAPAGVAGAGAPSPAGTPAPGGPTPGPTPAPGGDFLTQILTALLSPANTPSATMNSGGDRSVLGTPLAAPTTPPTAGGGEMGAPGPGSTGDTGFEILR